MPDGKSFSISDSAHSKRRRPGRGWRGKTDPPCWTSFEKVSEFRHDITTMAEFWDADAWWWAACIEERRDGIQVRLPGIRLIFRAFFSDGRTSEIQVSSVIWTGHGTRCYGSFSWQVVRSLTLNRLMVNARAILHYL